MNNGARVVAGVICLMVLVGTAVPVGGQSTSQTGIGKVSVSGSGVINGPAAGNNSRYIRQNGSVNVSVTVADYPGLKNYGVCLRSDRKGAPTKKLVTQCRPLSLANGTNGTVEFDNVAWPANTTGKQRLVVKLRHRSIENTAPVLDRKTMPVTVLQKRGDFDNDGLTNQQDVQKGYNLSDPDLDSDGLTNGAEVKRYGTNPRKADTDGDGVRDGVEVRIGTDLTNPDTDGDGLSDGTEVALGTNPTSPWTPIWLAMGGLVVLGVFACIFVLVRRNWHKWFDRRRTASTEKHGTEISAPNSDETALESTTEPSPPEPPTDEDRVLRLLHEHGERMKQSHIVEETEWSKAKVSRLLSSMADEETIEKLSIGRENLITLPGHGPEAANSPYDDHSDSSR